MTWKNVSLAGLLLLPLAAGCSTLEDTWPEEGPGRKRVLVSFPPIYCFVKNVAQDHAAVHCLLTSKGPHDYEAKTTDAIKVRGAELFFYNGLQLDDPFVKKLANSSGRTVPLIALGKAIAENSLFPFEHQHDHAPGHEHHHHGHVDPHVWLSPVLAQTMVDAVAAEMGRIDPTHQASYAANARSYKEKLQQLHAEGLALLKDKKNRSIVSMHESLRYFAAAFDLKIAGSIHPRAGVEPDPGKMKDLVELCKKEGVRVIAVEPQYPQSSAETLQATLKQRGVTVDLVRVDTLETARGAPNPDPGFYTSRMKENLKNLAGALP